jgi:hypothetical protein
MSGEKIMNLTLADLSGTVWTEEHLNIIKYVGAHTQLTLDSVLVKLDLYKGDYKKLINDYRRDSIIDLVMRQTDYTREVAYRKLIDSEGDATKVITEYVRGDTADKQVNTNADNIVITRANANKQMFTEIRNFMDNVHIKHESRDNANKKREMANTIVENVIVKKHI